MSRKIRGWRSIGFGLVSLLAASIVSCTSSLKVAPSSVAIGDHGQLFFDVSAVNSAETLQKPYLVLVSIDGYRHDYNRLFSPPNLLRMAAEGVSAKGLIPPYPSKTFPSHYSIITGLKPGRHGIVSNEFYDPARKSFYGIRDRGAVSDHEWYFGEPLWVAAGRQGMLTASFFWVGSEAKIAGRYPNYFYSYDETFPYERRVDQVLSWLKLPEDRRPHLITLYFENVDTAGHRHGVSSKETRDAVMEVDKMIGRLREGLARLDFPVNLIVVSDHGMLDLHSKKVIMLDEHPAAAKALSGFLAVGRGPQMHLYLREGEPLTRIQEAQTILKKHIKNARVYKRSEMEEWQYASTPRSGDLIVDAEAPYVVGLRDSMPRAVGGNHGWNPLRTESMRGIFYAVGPQFKTHYKLPAIENIHVYPLVLRALQLNQLSPIDGRLEPMFSSLR